MAGEHTGVAEATVTGESLWGDLRVALGEGGKGCEIHEEAVKTVTTEKLAKGCWALYRRFGESIGCGGNG